MTSAKIDESSHSLIALAVTLDGDGVEFGLCDDGNLGVEVDAEILVSVMKKFGLKLKENPMKILPKSVFNGKYINNTISINLNIFCMEN